MTRSLHVALKDLGLDRTFVLYPGAKAYPIHEQVEVVPLEHLHEIAIAGREQGRGDRSGSNRSAAVRCGPIAPGAYSDPR